MKSQNKQIVILNSNHNNIYTTSKIKKEFKDDDLKVTSLRTKNKPVRFVTGF
jgi:hypothetical protein